VPPSPGITSALGCLLVDVRHDLSAMFLAHLDSVDKEALETEFERLEAEGRERLSAESVPEEQMSLQRLVDMRYLGQWRSLTVPVSGPVDLDEAVDRFHSEHERAYNYRRDGAPVEIYRLSVRAMGVTPKPQLKRHEPTGAKAEPTGARAVHFDASGDAVDTPCYLRSELAAGTSLGGPAIIDQLDSTTVVPPRWRAEVDEWLNIRMQRKDA
jgi:N-methylhydantoinase A